MKKLLNVVANVLLFAFLALAIGTVALTVVSKLNAKNKGDDAVSVFGYQMRIVETNSMGECDDTDVSKFDVKSIPQYSMVFIETVPEDKAEAEQWYKSLKVGDVLTFKYVYTQQVTITHRVISITPSDDGGLTVTLEGDNKTEDTDLLTQVINTADTDSPNYIVGKVVGHNFLFGLFLNFLRSPWGIIFIIIVPCLIIIILEVIRIVGIVNADKRKKEAEVHQAKDDELNELRRRLAELEKKQQSESEKGEDAQ